MIDFGKRLKEERERIGLSQAKFAEACGVGKTAQYTYERGDREPSCSYMTAAGRLGVDVLYLLTGLARGFTDDEGNRPDIARLVARSAREDFDVKFFLKALGIQMSAWEEIVRRNLRRGYDDGGRFLFTAAPGDTADPFATWGEEIAQASEVFAGLLESAFTLDSALLAEVLAGVDSALAAQGQATMDSAKKAQAVAMLYRAFKASGKVDPAMIEEAVKLAAS